MAWSNANVRMSVLCHNPSLKDSKTRFPESFSNLASKYYFKEYRPHRPKSYICGICLSESRSTAQPQKRLPCGLFMAAADFMIERKQTRHRARRSQSTCQGLIIISVFLPLLSSTKREELRFHESDALTTQASARPPSPPFFLLPVSPSSRPRFQFYKDGAEPLTSGDALVDLLKLVTTR